MRPKVKLGSDILKEQERVLSGKDEELDAARQVRFHPKKSAFKVFLISKYSMAPALKFPL